MRRRPPDGCPPATDATPGSSPHAPSRDPCGRPPPAPSLPSLLTLVLRPDQFTTPHRHLPPTSQLNLGKDRGMKPASFAWHGPRSVPEAVMLLAEHGPQAKVLAGGQSLVPVLAMRPAEPAHLVDINKLGELDTVTTTAAGVTVGALARHSRVEHDADAARTQPLLRQGLRLVAHPTIRNRGTTVGSLAHADPAGEMTAVLALCGGTVTAVSGRGRRVIAAADFFRGPLESALAPDELAVEAFYPALPARAGTAFVEIARRHGDYALCGVGAIAELNPAGELSGLRCGYLSVFDVPL